VCVCVMCAYVSSGCVCVMCAYVSSGCVCVMCAYVSSGRVCVCIRDACCVLSAKDWLGCHSHAVC